MRTSNRFFGRLASLRMLAGEGRRLCLCAATDACIHRFDEIPQSMNTTLAPPAAVARLASVIDAIRHRDRSDDA